LKLETAIELNRETRQPREREGWEGFLPGHFLRRHSSPFCWVLFASGCGLVGYDGAHGGLGRRPRALPI